MINHIYDGDILLSIIIKHNYSAEGIEFFTPGEFSQQLGYMHHPSGHEIVPHIHNKVIRSVEFTNEVLFIKSGVVQVNFYTQGMEYLRSEVLEKGDVILLASGGHGFKVLEEAEIIEVKQGPYMGDSDKTRF
jgi:hypothetical protein